eukprot:scaffold8946_cov268-Chaetoceros_neogracile.AAC.23
MTDARGPPTPAASKAHNKAPPPPSTRINGPSYGQQKGGPPPGRGPPPPRRDSQSRQRGPPNEFRNNNRGRGGRGRGNFHARGGRGGGRGFRNGDRPGPSGPMNSGGSGQSPVRGPPPPPPQRRHCSNGQIFHQNGGGGGKMSQPYGLPGRFQGRGPPGPPFQPQQRQHHSPNRPFQQQIPMNMPPNAMHMNPHSHQQQQQQPYRGNQFPSYQSMGNNPNEPMPNAQLMPLQQHPMQFQPQQQLIPQHPPPNMPAAPPMALNPSIVAVNWSTHKAPTGADYFYNASTGESTYNRPPCLGPDPAAVVPASPVKEIKKRGWTQHLDQTSGKVYYYDGTNTTWEKPNDFKNAPEESIKEVPSKKRRKKEVDPPVLYSNKAEADAAFKGLLLAKDISPTMKWNEIVKVCSTDKRWEACTTTGGRKQALAEYQTKRANELREEKRQEKTRAKNAFVKLLTDVLPSASAFNASNNTPFQVIRDSLSKDDRFYAVENEETREELYRDFVEEIRKRDERLKRSRKREAKDSFLAFLKSNEETGVLTFASTWQSFVSSLGDKNRIDANFVVSPHMSDQERQLYFADHVLDLQALEKEKTRRIREARRQAEKAQRDAFRDIITKYAKEGKILPSSRWRNVEEVLAAESSCGPVRDQGRNEPQNIFDDYVDEWIDVYHGDKAFLNNLMAKSKELVATADSKYEGFTKGLLDAAAYSPEAYSDVRRIIKEELPVSSAKLLFDELVASRKSANSRGRIGPGAHSRRVADDSSEDEGEIVEDGEVPNDNKTIAPSTITQDTHELKSE